MAIKEIFLGIIFSLISVKSIKMTRLSKNINVTDDSVYLNVSKNRDTVNKVVIYAVVNKDTLLVKNYRVRFNNDSIWYSHYEAPPGMLNKYALNALNNCERVESVSIYDLIAYSEKIDSLYYMGDYRGKFEY